MFENLSSSKKEKKIAQGFSLIELLVAMFILLLVMGAMVAVSIAGFRSYQKSKAIKTVTEDIGFAINSIAKDVRMGKIENGDNYANGEANSYLLITRNRGGRVCYRINSASVAVANIASGDNDCSNENYSNIVDLSGTGMSFAASSAFRSCLTDHDGTGTACNGTAEKRRGWVEINLNIESPTMETDAIRVQTIVSSRDYGWEE